MSDFRIKKTVLNGHCSYEVERLNRIFGWVAYKIQSLYHIHTDYNANPTHGGLLIQRHFVFSSEQAAQRMIELKKRSFEKIQYRGETIVEVYNEHNPVSTLFVNKSYYRWWNGSPCYEFANTIEELKKKIDTRLEKPTISYKQAK